MPSISGSSPSLIDSPRIGESSSPPLEASPTLEFLRADSSIDNFELSAPTAATSITSLSEPPSREVKFPKLDVDNAEPSSTGFFSLYGLKKYFWASVVYLAFKLGKVEPLSKPANEKLPMVKLEELEPTMKIDGIYVTKDVPKAEVSGAKQKLYAMIRWLGKRITLDGQNLPSISATTGNVISEGFPSMYQGLLTAPALPPELEAFPNDVVGTLALQGPFAGYVEKVPGEENSFKIDMTKYSGLPVHKGLKELGSIAYFTYSPSEKRMNTTHIEYEGKVITKGGDDWIKAQRATLAALSTDTTVMRHLVKSHWLVGGVFTAASINSFDKDHPLRRLLHPHGHLTLSTNNYKTPNLIQSDSSVVPGVFSYSQKDLCKAGSAETATFNIATMDPVSDAKLRGLVNDAGNTAGIAYPYYEDAKNLWNIINDYVGSYLDAYYDSDEALAEDPSVQAWYKQLNQYVPNGIEAYAGGISKESIRKLASLFIYTASVEHENVGNITWNYTLNQNYVPSVVREDGGLPSVGMYQRYVNLMVLTFLPQDTLASDHSSLALDIKGKACMDKFRADLMALQDDMEKQPHGYHRLYPKDLESSVSS